MSRWLIIAVAAVLIAGCKPYLFDMSGAHPLDGTILTSLSTVDPGVRTTRVKVGGAIELTNYGVPEYEFSAGIRLAQGRGFRVLIHPHVALHEVTDSGLVAEFTTAGASLHTGTTRLATRGDMALADSNVRVLNILSEAHFLQVILGCDTLYRGVNNQLETDDLVISSIDSSTVEINSPDWDYVPGLRSQ